MDRLADHAEEIERLYFTEHKSYSEIGETFGRSREAVRQFLNRYFPDRMPGREFRTEIRRTQRTQALTELPAKAVPRCVICGEPVTRRTGGRGKRRTCSPEHSLLWSRARFLLDEDLGKRQRQSMAESILRYPDRHKESSVSWAKKVLEGQEVMPRREYARRDSEARKAFEEVLRIRAEKGYNPDREDDDSEPA